MHVVSRVIDFLSDRRVPCAECALYERQIVALQEDLDDTEASRVHHKRLFHAEQREVAKLEGSNLRLLGERDGFIRELFMERMQREEMRRDFEGRYQQLSLLADLLRTRLEHAEGALADANITLHNREMEIRDLHIRIENLEGGSAQ
jgi:hypothetical protein